MWIFYLVLTTFVYQIVTCNGLICGDGFYNYYYWSCQKCPLNCATCSSQYDCGLCVNGYYGYLCKYRCSGNCAKCTSLYYCDSCITGYYRYNNIYNSYYCTKCPEKCSACESDLSCRQCKPGYFGNLCQSYCSPNCDYGECEKADGWCQCKTGFYNEDSVGNNLRNICLNCSSSCESCTSATSCTTCIPGYFGNSCARQCKYCLSDSCKIDTGLCVEGCKAGYYQNQNECITCPNNCLQCESDSECLGCKPGYYGITCQRRCSDNCLDCRQYDGYCSNCGNESANINGTCTSCNKCSNKTSCSLFSLCSTCLNGFWGQLCGNKCSGETCTRCNKETGECNGCKEDTYGRLCDLKCNSNCLHRSHADTACLQRNGTCVDGCKDGFTGHTCAEAIQQVTSSSTPLVVGSSCGTVILIGVLVVVAFIVCRRHKSVQEDRNKVVDSTPFSSNLAINPVYDDSLSLSADDQEEYSIIHDSQTKSYQLRKERDQRIETESVYDIASTGQMSSLNINQVGRSEHKDNDETYSHIDHSTVNVHRYHGEDEEYDHVGHHNMSRFEIDDTYDVTSGSNGGRDEHDRTASLDANSTIGHVK